MSSKDRILSLLAQGYSYSSIGDRVGRDSSLISQIAAGKKPGHNLEGALTELDKTGSVAHPPLRRTTKAGTIARVRGTAAAGSVFPTPPPGQKIATVSKSTAQPQKLPTRAPVGRNRFQHTVNKHPNGWEMHTVRVPRRLTSPNRAAGDAMLTKLVTDAAASGKRLSGTIWAVRRDRATGRLVDVEIPLGDKGGYTAQSVASGMKAEGGFGWLQAEVRRRYKEGAQMEITRIDVTIW